MRSQQPRTVATMKRGVLVATFAVVVAGVASAGLLTSTSQGVASSAQAAAPSVAPVEAQAPVRRAAQQQALPPVAPPAPTVQRASRDPRQAPVLLLVKPRPAVNLPNAASADAPVASTSTEVTAPAEANANESVARAA